MSSFAAFFQQCLHRCAVFAHDVEVIPPCLVCPGLVGVQRPELAESVCGEQHLLTGLIAHHDFRPVYHGCHDEVQGVAAQFQRLALFDGTGGIARHIAQELGQHPQRLCRANQGHVRIVFCDRPDAAGVIRLHVGDHQIVRRCAVQHFGDLFQPLVRGTGIYGVQQGCLFVPDDIGVIGDAVRDGYWLSNRSRVLSSAPT